MKYPFLPFDCFIKEELHCEKAIRTNDYEKNDKYADEPFDFTYTDWRQEYELDYFTIVEQLNLLHAYALKDKSSKVHVFSPETIDKILKSSDGWISESIEVEVQ